MATYFDNADTFKRLKLNRIQDTFAQIIKDLTDKNGGRFESKKELAAYVDIGQQTLTKLTSYSEEKRKYGASLTGYYLMPFIVRGIIMPETINDHDQHQTDREKAFWRRAELQATINEAENLGMDPNEELRKSIAEFKRLSSIIRPK
jgi:hypothetical protein